MTQNESVEKTSNRKIAAGTILGYIALALSVLSSLFFTPWIKESIGNSMYGIYTLALSVINLFLIDFGLGNSINAYVSKYRANGDIKNEDRFLTATLKIYLLLDFVILLIFVVVYFLIDFIYAGLTIDEKIVLKNVFIILAGFSCLTFPSSLFNGILKAYEEFGWIKCIEMINKLAYIGLTAASLALNLGVYAVIGSYAISSLVNALLLFTFVRFKVKKRISLLEKTTLEEIKQIATFSGYGFIQSIASRLIFTIAPSVLGIVSDSTNIAVFGTCSSLEGYVYSFSSVMSGFFMPKIKRIGLDRSNPEYGKKIEGLAIKVGKIQTAFVLVLVIGFIAVGDDFISVWMQHDSAYSNAYLGTILLILYQIVNVAQIIFLTAMTSEKETLKVYSLVIVGTSLFNVALMFAFGYIWGSLGACGAIFTSHCFELVLVNFLYKKYLHVRLALFFKQVYFGFIPAALFSLAAALLFHYFLPFSSVINVCISGSSVVLIYLSLCWLGFGIRETSRFFQRMKIIAFRMFNKK